MAARSMSPAPAIENETGLVTIDAGTNNFTNTGDADGWRERRRAR